MILPEKEREREREREREKEEDLSTIDLFENILLSSRLIFIPKWSGAPSN